MNYLIKEQSQLTEIEPLFKDLAAKSGVVAVDTEFLHEKTYKARLCLIQLAIGEHQYCIDVITIEDLSSVSALLADQRVTKLFHAARQDMEVIYQTLGVLPKPIFDTQLAAAFLGMDMQIGYGGLVLEQLAVDLPKTQSRTDWTRRPLSAEQVKYAGDDVAYLEALYRKAIEQLEAQQKLDWYWQEIESYYDVSLYVIDPALAYKRLSGGGFKLAQQYTLKALAEWREAVAQKKDIPRTWVLRDDRLYDLVAKSPASAEEIIEMGFFGKKSAKYLAPQAANIIATVEMGESKLWRAFEPLQREEKKRCKEMMAQVRADAETHTIAPALLATRKDIEHLYRLKTSEKLLSGWRKNLIGESLLKYAAN